MALYVKTCLEDLTESEYEQFRDVIIKAFKARGSDVINEFFDKIHEQDIAYILLKSRDSKVVGATFAIFQESDKRMQELGYTYNEYVVIDKFAVSPEEQGNGIFSSMIYLAKGISFGVKTMGDGKPRFSQKQLPTFYRYIPELDGKYKKHSDFPDEPAKINGYHVNSFGFYERNGKPLYSRELFEYMAGIVAGRSKTVL